MSATSDTVVEVRSLTKDFGPKRALDCLNLNVSAVEIHGFLGPNAAAGFEPLPAFLRDAVGALRRRGALMMVAVASLGAGLAAFLIGRRDLTA